jgi:hypothetical protein
MRNAHTISVGRPCEKYRLGYLGVGGRIIKMHLREVACEGVAWIELA